MNGAARSDMDSWVYAAELHFRLSSGASCGQYKAFSGNLVCAARHGVEAAICLSGLLMRPIVHADACEWRVD
jgi:hypothetical protein